MENEKSTGNKYTVKDAAIIGIFCAVPLHGKREHKSRVDT